MKDPKLLADMGKRISLRRKSLGMTQEQVSEKMNVSVQMISNLEMGRKAIRPENLVSISKILQISTDYLLTGKGSIDDACEVTAKLHSLSTKQQDAVKQIIDLFFDAENE